MYQAEDTIFIMYSFLKIYLSKDVFFFFFGLYCSNLNIFQGEFYSWCFDVVWCWVLSGGVFCTHPVSRSTTNASASSRGGQLRMACFRQPVLSPITQFSLGVSKKGLFQLGGWCRGGSRGWPLQLELEPGEVHVGRSVSARSVCSVSRSLRAHTALAGRPAWRPPLTPPPSDTHPAPAPRGWLTTHSYIYIQITYTLTHNSSKTLPLIHQGEKFPKSYPGGLKKMEGENFQPISKNKLTLT